LKASRIRRNLIHLWTIGHSTRSIDDFIGALACQNISTLVDVRSFPGSRRYPHFNKSELAQSLAAPGIRYVHMLELGGRRSTKKDSHNTGLRNVSFRGYADYMETDSFRAGIDQLLEIAGSSRTAIMCAEALWWRCHRSLISDYLTSKGIEVIHILTAAKTELHRYTPAARIIEGELTYRGLLGE
jgi:uncharacterized protein (DUF488 family)